MKVIGFSSRCRGFVPRGLRLDVCREVKPSVHSSLSLELHKSPTVLIAESTKDATTQQLTGMAAELQTETRVSIVR